MADWYSTLSNEINTVLDTAVEGKTFTEYTLNSVLPVFSAAVLEDRENQYGKDTVSSRTLDYSKKVGQTDKVRIYYGKHGEETIKAKYGRKWYEVDFHTCAYTNQPCIYA